LNDFASFALCFGFEMPAGLADCPAESFVCADIDTNSVIDLADFASFALNYGLPCSGQEGAKAMKRLGAADARTEERSDGSPK
jgi:hypothetical protein